MSDTNALYNDRIRALAAGLAADDRLATPEVTVQADSPLCGSRIRVDLTFDEEGRIAQYGQQVRACALGRSAAAIVAQNAPGETAESATLLRDRMAAMLKHGAPSPDGKWAALEVLVPARDHKSRHASILLPFEAMVKGFAARQDPKRQAERA